MMELFSIAIAQPPKPAIVDLTHQQGMATARPLEKRYAHPGHEPSLRAIRSIGHGVLLLVTFALTVDALTAAPATLDKEVLKHASPTEGSSATRIKAIGMWPESTPPYRDAYMIEVQDGVAYLAMGSRGVGAFEISDITHPILLSELRLPGHTDCLAKQGQYVYAGGTRGLRVISITDPKNPRLVGSDPSISVRSIQIADNHLYLGGAWPIVTVMDASLPESLRLVATKNYQWVAAANDMAIAGNRLFIAGGNKLLSLDVAAPARPSTLATLEMVGYLSKPDSFDGIATDGKYAYVGVSEEGLRIYDMSAPSTWKLVGHIELPKVSASRVRLSGNHALLATSKGVIVINVEHPDNPSIVAQTEEVLAEDLAVVGNHAVVATRLKGLRIYRIDQIAVQVHLTILQQPSDHAVEAGQHIALRVSAQGTEPLSYQWKRNGESIPGATNSSWVIPVAMTNHGGSYVVQITDASGAVVTSGMALVTVSSTKTIPGDAKPITGIDFDQDGFQDLVWQRASGAVLLWGMDGVKRRKDLILHASPSDIRWRVVGVNDFNQDGNQDILWQHEDATVSIWFMQGAELHNPVLTQPSHPGDASWRIVASADFDGDRYPDLVWQHRDGWVSVWFMLGESQTRSELLAPAHPGDSAWRVVASGDFDRDGKSDLLWQHHDGSLSMWFMVGASLLRSILLEAHPGDARWRVAGVSDLDRDGHSDLLWQHTDGGISAWLMNGSSVRSPRWLDPPRAESDRAGDDWRLVGPR